MVKGGAYIYVGKSRLRRKFRLKKFLRIEEKHKQREERREEEIRIRLTLVKPIDVLPTYPQNLLETIKPQIYDKLLEKTRPDSGVFLSEFGSDSDGEGSVENVTGCYEDGRYGNESGKINQDLIDLKDVIIISNPIPINNNNSIVKVANIRGNKCSLSSVDDGFSDPEFDAFVDSRYSEDSESYDDEDEDAEYDEDDDDIDSITALSVEELPLSLVEHAPCELNHASVIDHVTQIDRPPSPVSRPQSPSLADVERPQSHTPATDSDRIDLTTDEQTYSADKFDLEPALNDLEAELTALISESADLNELSRPCSSQTSRHHEVTSSSLSDDDVISICDESLAGDAMTSLAGDDVTASSRDDADDSPDEDLVGIDSDEYEMDEMTEIYLGTPTGTPLLAPTGMDLASELNMVAPEMISEDIGISLEAELNTASATAEQDEPAADEDEGDEATVPEVDDAEMITDVQTKPTTEEDCSFYLAGRKYSEAIEWATEDESCDEDTSILFKAKTTLPKKTLSKTKKIMKSIGKSLTSPDQTIKMDDEVQLLADDEVDFSPKKKSALQFLNCCKVM